MDTWNAPILQSGQSVTYIDGKHGPGRPMMTWKQLTERTHRVWKLSAIDPHYRHNWRSGVISPCVQQGSYLERATLMWMLPCTCTLIRSLVMMMMSRPL